jgi:hypothetical protein
MGCFTRLPTSEQANVTGSAIGLFRAFEMQMDHSGNTRLGRNRYRRAYLIGMALFVLVTGVFMVLKALTDRDIAFLYSEQGAQWIRFREPTKLKVRWDQSLVTFFRINFESIGPLHDAVLHFRAMKVAEIRLDGQIIFRADQSIAHEWKKRRQIDLISALMPGVHELYFEVRNHNGHPALLAYCEPLNLYTGEHWESSTDGRSWHKALPVNDTPPLPLSRTLQRADRALISNLYLYVPIFLLVFLCTLLFSNPGSPAWTAKYRPTASMVRWILLSSWVIMAVNNIWKIPPDIGMDIKGHMQYITYLYENMRIPLATEGWQMFQPPLFYVLSAVVYKVFMTVFSSEYSEYALRIIPLFCGIAQVELYRTLRYAYPTRNDLQIVGTVIGGLLPMNLYMSQFAGNEPLAAFFTAVVILLVFKMLSSPSAPPGRDLVLTGLFLGLAVLTKMSAMLLALPVAAFLHCKSAARERDKTKLIRVSSRVIVFVFGVAFLVSGWYYIRNWIEMGQLFITGWDSSRNIVWWQDPGYRTPRQLFTFGESLFYPAYSAAAGFWDGLYSTFWMDGYLSAYNRPPWNYGFMLSGAWLSLLPSAAILTGMAVSPARINGNVHKGLSFASFSVCVYISAIFFIYLSLPVISSAKASYALGLTPCIAVLSAGGFDVMTRGPLFIQAVVYGFVACGAVAAYAAYFVI